MRKNDAYARIAKAYGSRGYAIKSIRIHRPTLIFWTVEASITLGGRTFGATTDGLTLGRLVRKVEHIYSANQSGGPT